MRNIKSTLRFARNSALLLVAASGVTYLTGCQSEHGLNSGNNEPTPEPSLSTASYSVHGANQGRVTNYGTRGTRDGEIVEATTLFDMPDVESIVVPSDAIDITSSWTDDSNPDYVHEVKYYADGSPVGGAYIIPAGAVLNGGIDAKNGHIDLYVAGSWNPDYIKGDMTVYVLTDGTLNYANEWMCSEPDVTIYNYGTISGEGVTFAGKLYSAVDITEALTFGVNDGADLYCKGTIDAKTVRLNGNAIACAFVADDITINSNGTIYTSYFKADVLTLNAGYVVLDNNGLVDATRINVSNEKTEFTVNGTNAAVCAKEFNTNDVSWPKKTFAAEIAVYSEKYMINGSSRYWDDTRDFVKSDFEFQVSSEDQVVKVPATGCHGGLTVNPDGSVDRTPKPDPVDPGTPGTPVETIPEIKKIVDIEGLDDEINHGDHDHGIISATCITFGADGTAYASYHLRGAGKGDHNQPNYVGEYAQKGCIEVIKDNGEAGMELGSYMISPDWDFNHLIVDGNRIITVGNQKKIGAFIGTLPVDFAASEGVREDFSYRELTTNEPLMGTSDKTGEEIRIGFKNAGDGNCVVRRGNYYYVATYKGYGPLALDFGRVNDEKGEKIFHSTPGSCKHISIDGDKMAVLAHDSYDKTESTASLYTFNADNYSFSNLLKKYENVGTIAPVDGKNVIAVDNAKDEVYVCLSKGGLARYNLNSGERTGFFQRGENKQVPVNGMAFDNKYIYVANGSFVSVLDKVSMKEICYYHAASQKSANYIALNNGKIYVAFGEDGIQVFQLVEKEITL